MDLGELYEQESKFSAALELKPLERKRLRKALGRSGDSVPLLLLPANDHEADESGTLEKPFPISHLKEVLLEAQLEHVCASAQYWCEMTGAVSLDEVCEHVAHFTAFLKLSPDEGDCVYLGLKLTPPARTLKEIKRKSTRFLSSMSALSARSKASRSSSCTAVTRQDSTRSMTSTSSMQCLIEVFQMLDEQKTGLVTPETLRAWIGGLGTDSKDAADMIEYCNLDENGLINYVEFVHLAMAGNSDETKYESESCCS